MKTLIVYYSFTKNNEILAKDLQKKLECDILKIEELKRRTRFTILLDLVFDRKPKIKEHNISLDDYEHIIFIAPIWAGKIASPLKTFLLREKNNIIDYSFITICSGREGQKDRIIGELKSLLNLEPEMVTELWINDLLPENQKDTIKFTTKYRIQEKDLVAFKTRIDKFIMVRRALDYRHDYIAHIREPKAV